MTAPQKQQYQALVEGLMGIRPLKTAHLQGRMELQRWILKEVQFFFPEANLVDVVSQIISPAVATQYPH
jgi:hypothetical protein